MKKILYLFSLLLFLGCNTENSIDCFQSTGDIIEQEFLAEDFHKIEVFSRVKLIFSQGDNYKVVVETGGNLINEVFVRVEDSTLKVSDRNSCNFVREFGVTKVYVTAPNLTEIRNSSGLEVRNQGPIEFDELTLISEDPTGEGLFAINGDFILDNLNIKILRVTANGLSKFILKGKAFNCHLGAADSDVRIDASELEIQHLYLFHRSTNKIICNPLQSIRGKIVGLGDVIALNQPPIVEVEEFFTGRLIFE